MKKYLTTAITLSILVTGAYAQQEESVYEQTRQKHEAAAVSDSATISEIAVILAFHEKVKGEHTQKIYETAEKYWAGKAIVPAGVVKSGQALMQFMASMDRMRFAMRDEERLGYLQEAEKHAKNIKYKASSKAQHDQALALAHRLGRLLITCKVEQIERPANPASEECSKWYELRDPLGATYSVSLSGYIDWVYDAAAARVPGVKSSNELHKCMYDWNRTKLMPKGCPDV